MGGEFASGHRRETECLDVASLLGYRALGCWTGCILHCEMATALVGPRTEGCDLNVNASHRLNCLNTWFQMMMLHREVWRTSLEEADH